MRNPEHSPSRDGDGKPDDRRRFHRRRKTHRRLRVGPIRPGRFFRPRRKLLDIRLDMKPFHLGECDWLLYRRQFNPYRTHTWNSHRYARGFAASKADSPKPNWDPIP